MSEARSIRPRYYRGSGDGKRPLTFDPLAKARARYDVIIVGSGLAGLTAANILGRSGHSVCILEQHYNFGGLATWFKRRGGHLFDISLHGFPVGMKKTCRKYWNRDIADRIVRLEAVRFDNPQFAFETSFTREDFSEKLVTVFGIPRTTVEGFFAHIRAMNFYDDSGQTVGELFEEYFPGRNDVHRLLMEPISYANGSSLDDPAITYGIVFSNFMSKGVYTYLGGTDHLIRSMRAELARNGVDLFGSASVERIVVEDERVRGVLVNGRFLEAPVVLSNANVCSTVLKLVGSEYFDADFVQQVRAVRLNTSSTQVYLGIRRGESIDLPADLLFTSTRPSFSSEALADLDGESRTFSFYSPRIRPGSGRYAVVSSMNARFEDWQALGEQEYLAAKQRLVRDTVAALERWLPGVSEKIDHREASTPRTFAFYTDHPAGTSFGTKFEGLAVSSALPEKISGLYHAGSVGIIMSGWLGAANYGAITANRVETLLMDRAPLAPQRS